MKSKELLLLASRLTVVAAFALVATLPAAAQGAKDQLKGTYFATGAQTCLVSPAGFTNQAPNNLALAFVQSGSVQGSYTFNLDGTGTAQLRELLITQPPATSTSATSSEQSFSFTYTVADDGTLEIESGPVTGTLLTGPPKGATFTLADSPVMSGKIGRNGMDVNISTIEPNVEMLTLNLPTGALVLPRVCNRSRILISIHVGDK